MAQELNQPRKLLFAFMNGSYKTIDAVKYDHKEWIIVEKKDGTKAFINSANVKWIEEIKPAVNMDIKPAPYTYVAGAAGGSLVGGLGQYPSADTYKDKNIY